MKTVYICSDSAEGILSAVYDAWVRRDKDETSSILLQNSMQTELFCEYRKVDESSRKAAAVERMIQTNLGGNVCRHISYAALSCDKEKADAILGLLMAARKMKDPRKIMENLGCPAVQKVFELSRSVGNEAHLLTGFIRFTELKNRLLFADITPKNQVLPCLGEHFQQRFPMENWIIRDKRRNLFLVHECGHQWVMVHHEDTDSAVRYAVGQLSQQEQQMQKLWKEFCNTITIKERNNPKCQQNNLPLRYRENMTEFT